MNSVSLKDVGGGAALAAKTECGADRDGPGGVLILPAGIWMYQRRLTRWPSYSIGFGHRT